MREILQNSSFFQEQHACRTAILQNSSRWLLPFIDNFVVMIHFLGSKNACDMLKFSTIFSLDMLISFMLIKRKRCMDVLFPSLFL